MEYLIPQWWFEFLAEQGMWLIFAGLLVSFAILFKGADWLVEGASGIATRLNVPKIIIGATIVSVATTSSEATVSVMAAFSGRSGLALGNGIGSVVCDTALIFGLCCCITTVPADKFILKRQGWVQFAAGVCLAVLCYVLWLFGINSLGRSVGVVMLTLLLWYMLISVKWAKQHNAGTGQTETPKVIMSSLAGLCVMFVFGLSLVLLGSKALIGCVTEICIHYGVPEAVIAATVVAFGTSLPELATALASIIKGHKELLVGNVIGADILNILFVIGASATAAELTIPKVFYYLHLPMLVVILVVFRIYSLASTSKGNFRRWYGVPLLVIYITYVVLQYRITI